MRAQPSSPPSTTSSSFPTISPLWFSSSTPRSPILPRASSPTTTACTKLSRSQVQHPFVLRAHLLLRVPSSLPPFCKLSFADLAFSSAFTFLQAPLSSPWTYLGTDIYGVPTPHAQLLGATSQATARIFDEAEELSLAAEDAFNIREDSLEDWEHLSSPSSRPGITNAPEPPPKDSSSSSPSYAPPPPPHDCSLAEREAHLQFSAHILKAELVGEFVFKTNSRGCFAFDGESARVGSEEEMMEKLREASFRDVLGDDKFGGEDSEKRAAWLDGALARKEYYSLPGAESPDCV